MPRDDSLPGALEARAGERPDALAFRFLVDGTSDDAVDLTYRELADRAAAIAGELHRRGLAGRRVVLALEPGLDYLAALFGILRAGAVAVPAFPPVGRRATARFASVVEDCAPDLVIANPVFAGDSPLPWLGGHELEGTPVDTPLPEPADLALLQYTSGSTGDPKGVMVSHGNLVANCHAMAANLGSTRQVSCSWLPPYHDMGLIGAILLPVFGGFPMVLLSPVHFVQQPYRWLKAISDHAVTTSVTPNFGLDLCVDTVTDEELRSLDLSTLDHLFCGAEPLRPSTITRFEQRFAPSGYTPAALVPCFGMAEATLFVSGRDRAEPVTSQSLGKEALSHGTIRITDEDATPIVSCGVVAPGHEVLIVDPLTRRPAPPDRIGELWVRGPGVTTGYFGKPELTAATFAARRADRPHGPDYLRTGDLGFLRDGELYLTGRIKDLIIVAGQNHYPHDVELTVRQAFPGARQVAAFGVSQDGADELVIVVETRPIEDCAAPREAITSAVAAAHGIRPLDVRFGPPGAVSVTTSGKVRRSATRDAYERDALKQFAPQGSRA